VKANQVEKQDAEQENGRCRQNCTDEVGNGDEQVVVDSDEENGRGTQHPEPSVFLSQSFPSDEFKDEQNDEDAGCDGEELLARCQI